MGLLISLSLSPEDEGGGDRHTVADNDGGRWLYCGSQVMEVGGKKNILAFRPQRGDGASGLLCFALS